MTEQQQHLSQLLQQRSEVDASLSRNRDLLLKLQGAIEYLQQIGVTLPEPEETVTDEVTEETSSEESEESAE